MHVRAIATVLVLSLVASSQPLSASGHGPMFGMATPTNAAGGWAIDFGTMGRIGETDDAATARTMLTYGITEDLQISGSVPLVFASAPLPAARMTGMMPGGGDFESILAWRFHRQGTNVGSRVETTAYGGVIVPGPQKPAGLIGTFARAPGMYAGIATGFASRGNYVWGGIGYTRFRETSVGDRRPTVLSYSAVWGYRPPVMRQEYPHWDWRLFAEMTGEKSSTAEHFGDVMSGTDAHQIYIGPSALGIYKNYAIEAGIQFPAYRDSGARLEGERFRYAANISYFF
ncbi:MAG: hypothetical protein HY047_05030 [Acidobacteria bacterium]|nr:hypothetical protein [Acidobacteriota bacterium]